MDFQDDEFGGDLKSKKKKDIIFYPPSWWAMLSFRLGAYIVADNKGKDKEALNIFYKVVRLVQAKKVKAHKIVIPKNLLDGFYKYYRSNKEYKCNSPPSFYQLCKIERVQNDKLDEGDKWVFINGYKDTRKKVPRFVTKLRPIEWSHKMSLTLDKLDFYVTEIELLISEKLNVNLSLAQYSELSDVLGGDEDYTVKSKE